MPLFCHYRYLLLKTGEAKKYVAQKWGGIMAFTANTKLLVSRQALGFTEHQYLEKAQC